MDYKSNLKRGDLQGINDGLMSLVGLIAFSLNQDLFCYLNFKLQVMSAFVTLCKFICKQDFECEKRAKAVIRNNNRC